MKRIIQTLIIISLLCGCQDRLPSVRLELSESVIDCGNAGGEFKVGISGRSDWTTDNTADWISIRRSVDGATVIIEKNQGGDRSRTVSFKLEGSKSASLEIRQAHSDEFSIDKEDISIGYKGGSATVDIICHDVWEASSDSDWISIDRNEGKGPYQLAVEVGHNHTKEARSGKITISNNEKNLTINILQALSPVIEIESEEARFDGDGGQRDILFMSNTEDVITCDEPWIRLIDHGSNIRKVSFEVLRNLGESRTGKIRLESADDREIFKEITVVQGPKIDHPALSFAEGTSLTLTSKDPVTIHPIFTDMTDNSLHWKSESPEIAEVDQEGNVSIHLGGTCVISARNDFHDLEASITLNIMPKAESMVMMFGTQNMKEVPIAIRFPGEKGTLSVIMHPADSYAEDIVYFSSDPAVGEIIGQTLYCRSEGTATIYAESLYQGIRESFTLMVRE